MLNEILEFEAYVTNPKSNTPRIQPYLFTESFGESMSLAGLEQILTTIARGFIHSFYFKYCKEELYTDGLLNEKLVKTTAYILQRWCGFKDIGIWKDYDKKVALEWFKMYPESDGWLKKYWMHHFENGMKTKHIKKNKEQLWKEVENKWSESLNSKKDFRSKSITYRNVIANSLEMGPLQNRYLIFRKDSKTEPVKEKDRFNYLYQVYEGASKPQVTTKMKLLKNIAAYLILLKLNPEEQKEVLLKRSQLLGWYGQDDTKNDSKIWYLETLIWNEESIFQRNETNNSYIKLQINSDYIEYFDFQLIDESEVANKENSEYWILEDCGHGLNDCWKIK